MVLPNFLECRRNHCFHLFPPIPVCSFTLTKKYYLELLNKYLVAEGDNIILKKKPVDYIIIIQQNDDSNDTCMCKCYLSCSYMLANEISKMVECIS